MTKSKLRIKKIIASVMLMVILFSATGITNMVHATDYLILKGTVITGANYNQPLGSFYEERVDIGTTKLTGITQTWSVETGMHEFSYDRRSINPVIPVSKWVALQFENENNSQGACIHGWLTEWKVGDNYFTWSSGICKRRTIPAWSAFCADCGQSIAGDTYIYLNSAYVDKITSIDCSENSAIASGCIFCGAAEQATTISSHTCRGASYNKYYVSYNGNGATGGSTGITTHMYENATTYDGVPIDRSTKLAQNGFVRSGYVFIGWNTKADGTGASYSNGQEIKNLTETDGATITLYAQWVKDNFNLTVNPNSGTWEGSTETQIFNISYQGTKAIPVPTKIGYDFTGWTLAGDGSTMTSLTGDATFTMGAGDATLTANWKPIQYQVVYNGNGATSGSTASSTHIYDQEQELTTNGYQRNYQITYNYNGNGEASNTVTATATFNGWANSNSGAVSFRDNQIVKNLRTASGTYNLYANWTLGSVILPDSSRIGYNSLGWSTSQTATTPSYSIGQKYTPASDTTLYMIWEPYSLKVDLSVQDEETKNIIAQEAVWDIYEWNSDSGEYVKKTTLVRQENGHYITQEDLTYSDQNEGKYRLVEQKAPNGYYGDWEDEEQTGKKTYDFNILTIIQNQQYEDQIVNDKGTIYITKENKRQKAKIDVDIQDQETKKAEAQADATLEGATYGLYAKEDILHIDGVTGIIYHAGELVERSEIKNGSLSFENLELGNYEIREISPSEGYVLNQEAYPINILYESEKTQYIEKTQTVEQKVKKQAFQLIKLGGLETDTDLYPLKGAGFKIYLISSLEKVKQGDITPDSNGNYRIEDFKDYDFSTEQTALDYTNNQEGEVIPEAFTDENGLLVSKELAYGKYIVIESTVPENHLEISPFLVNITEDSRTAQELGTFLDRDFTAKIKIVKKDNTSKKIILKANAKYRILDMNTNRYVEQEVDGIIIGTEENPYTTDETGSIITPIGIRYGNYELQEVGAPEGYVLTGKEGVSEQGNYIAKPRESVKFTISEETVREIDSETNEIMLIVEQFNERQVGSLTIQVRGEYLTDVIQEEQGIRPVYENRGIPNATFEVYAKEDIYSPDKQGEILYHQNEKVKTIVSNENGNCIIDELPLGSYYIKQTQVGKGFVLNTEQKEIELTYAGEQQAISYASVEYKNERQKVNIILENKDQETKEAIKEGIFGLYTKEEIVYEESDGTIKTIPANTLVSTQTTNEEGKIIWNSENQIDLPLGHYEIRQIQAPEGYASNQETIEIDASYQDQQISAIEKQVVFENVTTRIRIKLQDKETKQGLAGANLRIIDEEGNEIKSWTTDMTGEIIYKGLSYGKKYILEEVEAREKYEKQLQYEELAGEIEGKLNEQGNIEFILVDSMQEQQLTVMNLAKVGSLKIEKRGDVLIGTQKDEEENIQFLYEKQKLSNAKFEIYASENIEHPDGHTGVIFTKGMKIAEGITNTEGLSITKVSEDISSKYIEEIQKLLERGLILGEYRIIEVKAPEGYYKDPNQAEKIIKIEDEKGINRITKEVQFNNPRQTVETKIHKYDAETKESIKDVTLGIYLEKDLVENGVTILEKDTLIQKGKTNEEGIVTFEGKIPLGNYYVQEIEAGKGYIQTLEQIQIQAENLEENRSNIEVNIEFANQKTKLDVIKTTMEGQGIIGAKLQIIDEENQVVDSWSSDGYMHRIQGLETEKNYILQETTPADGFVTARNISFSIDKWGELITKEENAYAQNVIQMKDEYTKVDISIVDKQTQEPIAGITVQIINKETGEKILEYVTTEEPQRIIGLPIGEYDVIQTKLPKDKGYVTTNATLTIIDTEEVQEKIIEQDSTKIKLEVIDEETEDNVENVEIYLVDKKTKDVIASTENIENKLKIEKTEDGYVVEKIPIGEYILVQKVPEGYLEIEMTDFTIENTKEEQKHTSLTRKLILDMQVEKQIGSIIINGEKREIQNAEQMQKIEVVASKLQTEQIEIEYIIKISNTGEIAGNVGKIIEQIPEGFTYENNKNATEWKKEGNYLMCDAYADTEIKVGESIELNIRLKWDNGENNFGEKINTVTIEGVTNKLGYIDETKENNTAIVKTIMSIKTGQEENIKLLKAWSIAITALGIISILVIIEIRYLKRKEK